GFGFGGSGHGLRSQITDFRSKKKEITIANLRFQKIPTRLSNHKFPDLKKNGLRFEMANFIFQEKPLPLEDYR
ncbi:MAG TPA: hypothetical protein VE131_06495, partial [Terriglobales bacterium]|nr:hypothetical protein [Terriglobales bacterium]